MTYTWPGALAASADELLWDYCLRGRYGPKSGPTVPRSTSMEWREKLEPSAFVISFSNNDVKLVERIES